MATIIGHEARSNSAWAFAQQVWRARARARAIALRRCVVRCSASLLLGAAAPYQAMFAPRIFFPMKNLGYFSLHLVGSKSTQIAF